jgi:hypothetical protein
MEKLLFAVLVAGVGLIGPQSPVSLPLVIEVRAATGERVVLRVNGGDGVDLLANAAGLRTEGRRLTEFVAPGTLEIRGGEGELELNSAHPRTDFVLVFKRGTAGVTREFETRGQHAVIRVRGSEVTVSGETITMREVRSP